jgi:hypothetical protein
MRLSSMKAALVAVACAAYRKSGHLAATSPDVGPQRKRTARLTRLKTFPFEPVPAWYSILFAPAVKFACDADVFRSVDDDIAPLRRHYSEVRHD